MVLAHHSFFFYFNKDRKICLLTVQFQFRNIFPPSFNGRSRSKSLGKQQKMYEKHFLNELVKGMRSTVNEGGFIQKNFAEKNL